MNLKLPQIVKKLKYMGACLRSDRWIYGNPDFKNPDKETFIPADKIDFDNWCGLDIYRDKDGIYFIEPVFFGGNSITIEIHNGKIITKPIPGLEMIFNFDEIIADGTKEITVTTITEYKKYIEGVDCGISFTCSNKDRTPGRQSHTGPRLFLKNNGWVRSLCLPLEEYLDNDDMWYLVKNIGKIDGFGPFKYLEQFSSSYGARYAGYPAELQCSGCHNSNIQNPYSVLLTKTQTLFFDHRKRIHYYPDEINSANYNLSKGLAQLQNEHHVKLNE